MHLSPHFTLEELTRSEIALRRGLNNTPAAEILSTLRHTAAELERVRTLLGYPIQVNSGYRSPDVNAAVGGSSRSQHVAGEAVDFVAPGYGSPLQVCRAIAESALEFDQLIYEGAWVHISFTRSSAWRSASAPFGRVQRRQVLTAHFSGGRVTYTPGV